jgi:NADH-quinone oxidoreductase subunit M
MNISLLGLFLSGIYGISGSILLSLSHGFVSGGLFFLVGFLYDRFNTRNLLYFGGFSKIMPLMSFMFFIFLLANASFPGFLSFIGEFMILLGLFDKTLVFVFILSIFLIFGTIYCIWFYDHIFNGVLKENIVSFYDITRYEFFIVFILFIVTLFFGIFPNILLEKLVFLSMYLSIN